MHEREYSERREQAGPAADVVIAAEARATRPKTRRTSCNKTHLASREDSVEKAGKQGVVLGNKLRHHRVARRPAAGVGYVRMVFHKTGYQEKWHVEEPDVRRQVMQHGARGAQACQQPSAVIRFNHLHATQPSPLKSQQQSDSTAGDNTADRKQDKTTVFLNAHIARSAPSIFTVSHQQAV